MRDESVMFVLDFRKSRFCVFAAAATAFQSPYVPGVCVCVFYVQSLPVAGKTQNCFVCLCVCLCVLGAILFVRRATSARGPAGASSNPAKNGTSSVLLVVTSY